MSTAKQSVTFGRGVRSEWVKLRTVRSTWWLAGLSFVAVFGIGCIVGIGHKTTYPLKASSALGGTLLATLLIGSLGVLFVTGEYATGMIRSTFTAVPKRTPIVWGKALLLIAVLTPLLIATNALTVVVAGSLSKATHPYSLTDATTARIVVGGGFALALFAALGSALGWLIRSSPGALVSFFLLTTVAPSILATINSTCERIAEYAPPVALAAVLRDSHGGSGDVGHRLSSGAGLLVLLAWVVVPLVLSQVRVRRSDVAPG